MHRREFVVGSVTAAAAGIAGCLGGSPGATDDVVLDEPAQYDKLRDSRERGAIGPIHADALPGVAVPDALGDGEVATRQYVGDRHILLTFVFARCSSVCPGLTAALAQVQANARSQGYADELAFMPITFDPTHDTPAVLDSFSEDVGAVPAAEGWHFLRPANEARAKTVVTDRLGVWFERVPESERAVETMAYSHDSRLVLANADGYIERAYTGNRVPSGVGLLDDVDTLRERW